MATWQGWVWVRVPTTHSKAIQLFWQFKDSQQWYNPQRDKWDIFCKLHYSDTLNSKFSSSLPSLLANELILGNDIFDFQMQQPSPNMPNINIQPDEPQLPKVNTTLKAHAPFKPLVTSVKGKSAWPNLAPLEPRAKSGQVNIFGHLTYLSRGLNLVTDLTWLDLTGLDRTWPDLARHHLCILCPPCFVSPFSTNASIFDITTKRITFLFLEAVSQILYMGFSEGVRLDMINLAFIIIYKSVSDSKPQNWIEYFANSGVNIHACYSMD